MPATRHMLSTDPHHTPAALLRDARQQGVVDWEAKQLLSQLSGQSRAWLVAHDDQPLPASVAVAFGQACQRRLGGEPVAYLLGEQEFHGLRLRVTPAVLVPRPDTEVLVDWGLACLQGMSGVAVPRVLDLGTGSGAIALAMAASAPQAQVTAVDLSEDALHVARGNAQSLGLAVRCLQGSWWAPVSNEVFDLVLSNPPYIAGDDPHLLGLQHEPTLALTPGGDGLDAYRHIIAQARPHLAPGAWLLLEHGWDQADAVQALLRAAGFAAVQSRQDLAGHVRCSGGQVSDAAGV